MASSGVFFPAISQRERICMINNCSVKGNLHSNRINSLRKIFSPLGCIFPLMWTATEMNGKNRNGRFSAPDCVSMHFKTLQIWAGYHGSYHIYLAIRWRFSLKSNSKNLDQYFKLDLDFGHRFRRGKTHLIAGFLIFRLISKMEKHGFIAKTYMAGLVFTCLNVLTTFCIL